MLKYLLSRLFQVSGWIGFLLMLFALFTPRWFIILFGIILVFIDDEKLKAWVAKNAPSVTAKIEEWTK